MVEGRPNTLSFSAVNSISITPGFDVHVEAINAELVSSSAVGNRQIYFDVLDASSNLLFRVPALNVQAASLTDLYNFIPGVPNEDHSSATPKWFQICIPEPAIFQKGWTIKIYDNANIDNSGDALTAQMIFRPLG